MINKIDIPEVREKLEELTKGIKAAAGHTRVLGISAATGERFVFFFTCNQQKSILISVSVWSVCLKTLRSSLFLSV